MFEPQDGYDAYQFAATQAKAASADPHQLVLMLMDGLLDEIARAEGHILAKQFERKGQAISKCLQILGGLDSALDMEKGGELAANLHRLYDYCGQKLFEISVSNNVAGFAEVRSILGELKDGWEVMARQPR
ncbi:lateral flagellar export chaperone LafC [Aeromonas enteropelogenes]|uniref:Flagellar secretion chaperone FliS n=2 Tax=Aeromonas TaxID=642 RepID=A0A175VH06_AEREN|nr:MULTISPECIES: lateral flagellar export chaperone LafC [Aeromonas]KXU79769.1 flagellar protein FliS [Aeromonas enteropelogenes]MBL0458075.1 lateral flagellar export chaperone LafC [Aeromonas enteropelogenes]MBL0521848.1 lateral flagellar export chaperone LafC [Aeromonas enteropelogenes]MCZ0752120.1 lateral flagellar export chaperone LafC [Aeromonas enteropelogenes]QXC35292.1 lateral flagellar export chaperone LafC [Aeromonas sp. FDAARGOS 1407]